MNTVYLFCERLLLQGIAFDFPFYVDKRKLTGRWGDFYFLHFYFSYPFSENYMSMKNIRI